MSKDLLKILGYTPTGRELGRGAWSDEGVQEYTDSFGANYAAKKISPTQIAEAQEIYRNLNLKGELKKESLDLEAAAHNLMPRFIIGEYILMPVEETFLCDIINDLSQREKIFIIQGIYNAGEYLESKGRIHGDWKPENIAVRNRTEARVTDLGTSTYFAPGRRSENPRDNLGEIETRAYECFKELSHLDTRSEVYAKGALVGRLLTGSYPRKGMEEGLVINQSEVSADTMLEEYVKEAPFAFRKFLTKSLRFDPKKRYLNSTDAKRDLKKAIKLYERTRVGPVIKAGAAAASIIAMVGCGVASSYLTGQKLRQKIEEGRVSGMITIFVNSSSVQDTRESFEARGIYDGYDFVFNQSKMGYDDDEVLTLAAMLDSKGTMEALYAAGIDPRDAESRASASYGDLKEQLGKFHPYSGILLDYSLGGGGSCAVARVNRGVNASKARAEWDRQAEDFMEEKGHARELRERAEKLRQERIEANEMWAAFGSSSE
ncbi:MAG: protein kinase [archaeon]